MGNGNGWGDDWAASRRVSSMNDEGRGFGSNAMGRVEFYGGREFGGIRIWRMDGESKLRGERHGGAVLVSSVLLL